MRYNFARREEIDQKKPLDPLINWNEISWTKVDQNSQIDLKIENQIRIKVSVVKILCILFKSVKSVNIN